MDAIQDMFAQSDALGRTYAHNSIGDVAEAIQDAIDSDISDVGEGETHESMFIDIPDEDLEDLGFGDDDDEF